MPDGRAGHHDAGGGDQVPHFESLDAAIYTTPKGTMWREIYRARRAKIIQDRVGQEHVVATGYTKVVDSSPYTVLDTDDILLVDTAVSSITCNLPTAVGVRGKKVAFIKTAAANQLTIDGSGSQTINGVPTWKLSAQYAVAILVSDNANWLLEVLAAQGNRGSVLYDREGKAWVEPSGYPVLWAEV